MPKFYADVDINAPNLTITSDDGSTEYRPTLTLKSNADVGGHEPLIRLHKNTTGGASEDIGTIEFLGQDDGGNDQIYGRIRCQSGSSSGAADGSERGVWQAEAWTSAQNYNVIKGEATAVNQIDVVLGAGTTSTTTVAGDLAVNKITTIHNYDTTTFENQLTSSNKGSGEILKYGSGQDGAIGQLHYLHSDGSWDLADADGVASGGSQLLGIAMDDDPGISGMLLDGYFRIDSDNIEGTAVIGAPLYVSEEPGKFDVTPPSGDNDVVRIVGYCIDYHTDGDGDVLIRFKPDNTFVEVTA